MEKMEKIARTKMLPALTLLLFFSFAGCEGLEKSSNAAAQNPEELRIAIWNVQTLFDGDETGTEYDDYRNSAGWTDEKYRARLTVLAQAIEQMGEKMPDILGLIEIENLRILEDLVHGPLAKQGYNWTFFGNNPGSPLGIGILSRFPFNQTLVHSITSNGETIPRPILEIRLQVKENPLICFVCHWKSKLGDDDVTESLRKASARVIVRRLREMKQESPGLPVIVMGDLNENHNEFYRKSGSVISALLPDDPSAVELTRNIQTDFLILSPKKPPEPEYFAPEAVVLYSPWEEILEKGSYHYRNEWETIDHFLLSDALFDQTGWNFDSCKVIKQEPFINSNNLPYTYNPRTGSGLSDHLPLVLSLILVNNGQ